MKTHVKCGLLTALGWNVLLLIAFLIRARLKEVSVSYFFDDGTGGWGITALLIVWSLIWYTIGAHIRKEFLSQKEQYRTLFPLLEKETFNLAFKRYYFSRYAKTLGIVFTTAIPWYVIGYVREPLSCTDFTVIGPLMVLSVLCFWYYKKYRLA